MVLWETSNMKSFKNVGKDSIYEFNINFTQDNIL